MSEIIEYHQITLDEYMSAKQEISKRLVGIGENFVVIGYLLRQIEETKAYEQDGYASLKEFAKAEYGMSESGVSRFMAINKKFSIDGNSKELLPEYQGYGYSKLQEMLTLTDEDCKLITESTTVAEIREIKKFEREEQKMLKEEAEQEEAMAAVEETVERVEAEVVSEPAVNVIKPADNVSENVTNCHVLNEPESPSYEVGGDMATVGSDTTTYNWTDWQKLIIEFFRNERDLLTDIFQLSSYEDIADRINPSGSRIFKYKLWMLCMYGFNEKLILKKMGAGSTEHSWAEFIESATEIFGSTYTDHDSVWENFYGEPKKEQASTKEENEPVKEEKTEPEKSVSVREKSSDTGFDPTKTIYNQPEERVEPKKHIKDDLKVKTPENAETELEGQMNIENYPEALPEGFATSQEEVSVREKSTKTDILEQEKEVGRLTWYNPDGTWGLKQHDIKNLPTELYTVAYKLMQYEKTGLSPYEIEDMLNEKHNTEG